MSLPARVAITGATGRLGRALVDSLLERNTSVTAWNRDEYDLDDPSSAARVVESDRPDMVIHCAAWTEVDGCARDPALALRRNGDAVGELAVATAAVGGRLVLISTNEVFDGRRMDRMGYREVDPINPINPYGASKAAGEERARAAFAAAGVEMLWIVRTEWLYGAPGGDFPAKIVAAADRLEPGAALRVVSDEVGSPTWTEHLAPALLDLVTVAPGGTYHLAAPASVSRFEWARAVIDVCRPGTPVQPITSAEFARESTPPAWGVLDTTKAATHGVRLGDWRQSLEQYAELTC